MEKWENIKGYKDVYQVSTYGRVRSFRTGKPLIMAQTAGTWGYFVVNINKTPRLVHRLIAETYLPNPDNKPEVNHINGDKLDNLPTNLEWVTSSENSLHAVEIGLNEYTRSKRRKVAQYDLEGTFIREYESISAVARAFGKKGQHTNVRKVCEGRRKSFQGYVFEYI